MCEITSINNVVFNIRRMQLVGQYLGPFWDIYVDNHNKHRPEAHNCDMIAYLMIWDLGYVLAKYLDLYLAS